MNSAELGFVFAIFITVVSAIRCNIYQCRLYKYIRENHTEKWIELTTVFGFGPGLRNNIKARKFWFSKDYLGDPEVLRLKVLCKNSYVYVVTGIGAIFIMFIITMFSFAKT